MEDSDREGKLREDLYYRISTISVCLPPFRERREDHRPWPTVSSNVTPLKLADSERLYSAAADELRNYDWPGNVRQLQNQVQRAVLMARQPGGCKDLSISEGPQRRRGRPI